MQGVDTRDNAKIPTLAYISPNWYASGSCTRSTISGDPVRRRNPEPLGEGEQTSGAITDVMRAEFSLSQPAVSQHLRVPRENGFASVRAEGLAEAGVLPGPEPASS
ncbi:hypothetical protein ABZW11_24540 [Nonomuraea sp. NPDC004580]|uniref:ArsR/SmtB family transcription factor n=1 Tax=Nonomuraea sp. NPDC004580 TaxID=3154552 RepID=UPI0033B2D27E